MSVIQQGGTVRPAVRRVSGTKEWMLRPKIRELHLVSIHCRVE